MTNLNIFKKDGKFLMLALDHRTTFKKIINPSNPDSVKKEEIVGLKKKIIESTLDQMSGLLIDPFYGYEAYNQIKKDKGVPYLLCAERSGYEKSEDGPKTEIQYKVEQLKILGASGVKLLLPFHPHKKTVTHQVEIARRIIEDSKKNELPLFLEVIIDPNEGNEASLIIESLKLLLKNNIRPDVFKLDFPENDSLCKDITKILGDIPWILLTRGVGFEVFKSELQVATKNGAVGFLAGRALWQDIQNINESEREIYFKETLPDRFREISEVMK
jgi:tagatose 1,6-diphosphate aldolase